MSETNTDIETMRALGKQRKLWTAELVYIAGPEVKRWEHYNLTYAQMMRFRETAFKAGIMVPLTPVKWMVISPFDIKTIYLFLQERYIEEAGHVNG